MADCIVIGGGLIGMLTARELQQAGADVLILERGKLGGESSWLLARGLVTLEEMKKLAPQITCRGDVY